MSQPHAPNTRPGYAVTPTDLSMLDPPAAQPRGKNG